MPGGGGDSENHKGPNSQQHSTNNRYFIILPIIYPLYPNKFEISSLESKRVSEVGGRWIPSLPNRNTLPVSNDDAIAVVLERSLSYQSACLVPRPITMSRYKLGGGDLGYWTCHSCQRTSCWALPSVMHQRSVAIRSRIQGHAWGDLGG